MERWPQMVRRDAGVSYCAWFAPLKQCFPIVPVAPSRRRRPSPKERSVGGRCRGDGVEGTIERRYSLHSLSALEPRPRPLCLRLFLLAPVAADPEPLPAQGRAIIAVNELRMRFGGDNCNRHGRAITMVVFCKEPLLEPTSISTTPATG